jgi:hypothetical protein
VKTNMFNREKLIRQRYNKIVKLMWYKWEYYSRPSKQQLTRRNHLITEISAYKFFWKADEYILHFDLHFQIRDIEMLFISYPSTEYNMAYGMK